MKTSKLNSLRFRLGALEYLNAVKKQHSHYELQSVLDLKPSVLSRYVRGRVVPTEQRARQMISRLSEKFPLESVFLKSITVGPDGLVDNSQLVCDTGLLKLAASQAALIYSDKGIDRVVTMASDGIPYATLVADVLGAKIAVAKKEREKGVRRFLSSEVPLGDSGFLVSAHIPFDELKKGENCLIVDDIIRSGETQQALSILVKKAGCRLVGYSFLIAISDSWQKKLEVQDVHIVARLSI